MICWPPWVRDFRSGDVSPIDTGLLDLLHSLSIKLDTTAQFHVISGYRSPNTNADSETGSLIRSDGLTAGPSMRAQADGVSGQDEVDDLLASMGF